MGCSPQRGVTHQQNVNGSFSPLLTWEGGELREAFVQRRVLVVEGIKMMMGVLGAGAT